MSPYDRVPYPSVPVAQSHPDRLATIASLSGLRPAAPESCRVLEIGCAAGGNLIPMAAGLPGSQFVGIDASAVQLEEAERLVAELGLSNVELVHRDLGADGALAGDPFDYVVCQGVFSWVSPDAQEAILRLSAQRLAPQGVAYLNTNVFPGWKMRIALRDLLRHHTGSFERPEERIAEARALLDSLDETLGHDAFANHLRQELTGVRGVGDAYLFHEYLEGENRPLYFHELIDRTRAAGLDYLGEANFTDTSGSLFPERIRAGLTRASEDFVRLEQRADFTSGRSYRSSLFCLAGAGGAGRADLGACYAACRIGPRTVDRSLDSTIPEPFEFSTDVVRRATVSDPLVKAAVVALGERWPRSLSLSDLLPEALARLERKPDGGAARLEAGLLDLFARGAVRLSPRAVELATEVSPRPLAFAPARALASRWGLVPNLLHQVVALDPFEQVLVAALDGERDPAQLVSRLVAATEEGLLKVSVEGAPVSDPAGLEAAYAEALPERLRSLRERALLLS